MYQSKYIVRFCLLLSLLINSCASDKGNPETGPSEEQVQALSGNWELVQYLVAPPQDVNGDGTSSENLLDELACLRGTLTLSSDFSWNLQQEQLSISEITGGAFGFGCSGTGSSSGSWTFINNELLLSAGPQWQFRLNGQLLTRADNESLPGLQQLVYRKQ